jgi:ABC-type branched-subunit amino acid transport system ATPase component
MSFEKAILNIEDLTSGYNERPILIDLNLSLVAGETCCVIGEEGSGKSTLLKVITQQLKSFGKINYKDLNLQAVSPSEMTRQNIDFIAQGGNILPDFTVEEHICLALSEKIHTERSIYWQEVKSTFPTVVAMRKQIAGRLSGGERMLLSLACLMATDADVWILDEPTAGLSPEACRVIKTFLTRMKNEKRKTILLLEHNYEFAFEIADSVVTLKEGVLSRKYLPNEFRKIDFVDTELYGPVKI